MTDRAIRGDFQTPVALARRVLAFALELGGAAPARFVVEPTVGRGALLEAALEALPEAKGFGLDLAEDYVREARGRLGARAEVVSGDVFAFDFDALFARSGGPVLVVGNPPWVTSAAMTRLGGDNRPTRRVARGSRGLDAKTGASNFDVAEWIVLRMVEASAARPTRFAFIVKTQVARRVLVALEAGGVGLRAARLGRIDAPREFGAQVDACVLVFETCAYALREPDVAFHETLEAPSARDVGVRAGGFVEDVARFDAVADVFGQSPLPFRSGVKHDAAEVFELSRVGGVLRDARGVPVDVEDVCVFPFVKAKELASGATERRLLLPHRSLAESEAELAVRAPRAHAQLEGHAARLAARKSSIYRGRSRFAVFGVGPYSFAPFKVAVSALAREPRFFVVGPHEGKPTLLDDTSYFVGVDDADTAEAIARVFASRIGREAVGLVTQGGSKRVLTKRALDGIHLHRLAERAAAEGELTEGQLARVRAAGVRTASGDELVGGTGFEPATSGL